MPAVADDELVEVVLSVVEQIPRGRVTTYGAVGDLVGCGPRLIGNVMSRHGGPVPWWRVVRADGSLPDSHLDEGRAHYLEEGTPLKRSGRAVDIVTAFWPPVEVDSERCAALRRRSGLDQRGLDQRSRRR